MSQDFDDLKVSVDAVKQDLSDIKDKVAVVIAKLPDGSGISADEVAALKAELSDIHGTAGQVETNLDNAAGTGTVANPPVDTNPPVVNPPADTTPPVDTTPVV